MRQPFTVPSVWSPEASSTIEENFTKLFAFTDQVSGLRVVNGDTVTLWKGCAVYLDGGNGQLPVVLRALANADTTMPAIGLVKEPILPDQEGLVLQSGLLEMDTSGFAQDDTLYVSSTVAGQLTATAPAARAQEVATVVNVGEFGLVVVQVEGMGGAHNLLSATHLDATAAAVVRGDIITGQGATPAWARLAISATAGRFIRTDATDVGWSTLVLPNAATTGDILYASATNVMSQLTMAAVGNALISGGAGVAPSWAKVNLTSGATQTVSGTLPVGNGGTGLSSMVGGGRIMVSDGSTSIVLVSTAFNNRIILSQGTTPFVWSGYAVPTSAVLGDIWYGLDTTTISRLAGNTATAKNLLTQTGTGAVSAAPAWQTLATAIGHTLLDGSVHTDTTAQTVTRGSIITGQGVSPTWNELVIGAAARLLRSDGTDVSWAQAALTTDVTGVLPYANGGTNASTSWTAGSVIFAGASAFAQNNSRLFWDNAGNQFLVEGQIFSTSTGGNTPAFVGFAEYNWTTSRTILNIAGDGYNAVGVNQNLAQMLFTQDSATSAYISFGTNAGGGLTEKVRIDKDGNVGIATTGALVKLAVGTPGGSTTARNLGSVTIDDSATLTTSNVWMEFGDSTGVTNARAYAFVRPGSTGGNFSIYDITTGIDVARMTFNKDGNISIGTTVFPTTGTMGLVFGDGTALATMGTNTAGLYANDVAGTVEMFAIDEGGVATQISPHNFTLFAPETSEPFPWSYYSKNEYLNVEMAVDWGKVLRLLRTLFPADTFVHRRPLSTPRRDWVDDQETHMRRAMAQYEQWETTDRRSAPPIPALKPPPEWLRERLEAKGYINTVKIAALRDELVTWKAVRGL